MRLSLDVSAVPAAPGGAGRYTVELAGALRERHDVELLLWSRRGDARRWGELAGDPPRALVRAEAPATRPLRLAWEQTVLPRLLDRTPLDVHHGPHYTMPERARVPVVVTVHDCTFFDHPEWHERSKAMLFRRAIRAAARRSAAVVCVSETTADRLRSSVRGAGARLRRAPRCEPRPVLAGRAVARLGRRGAGARGRRGRPPSRGVRRDHRAAQGRGRPGPRVRPRRRVVPDVTLVLAGQVGWGGDDVARALASSHHADRVVRTGYVPERAVPALLRRASVVAYPSLEEGYGLPALEALACGAPLVTTAGTAMAEMALGAAVLVRPGDVDSLAGALEAVLTGGDAATAERRRAGLAVAAARTWEASADRHLEAYRYAALATHRRSGSSRP